MKRYLFSALFLILGIVAALPYPGTAATYRPPSSSIANDSITSAKITNGTIVNADVSSSAAINSSKLSFNGVSYTFPAADGASNAALTTDAAGALTWEAVRPSTGIATSTGDAAIYGISMSANDVLMVWYQSGRDRANDCSALNMSADWNLKQSGYAATTTVNSSGSNNGQANVGCTMSFFTRHVATTTETVSVQIDQTNYHNSSVMYQLIDN